jgi:hypothetical protein
MQGSSSAFCESRGPRLHLLSRILQVPSSSAFARKTCTSPSSSGRRTNLPSRHSQAILPPWRLSCRRGILSCFVLIITWSQSARTFPAQCSRLHVCRHCCSSRKGPGYKLHSKKKKVLVTWYGPEYSLIIAISTRNPALWPSSP